MCVWGGGGQSSATFGNRGAVCRCVWGVKGRCIAENIDLNRMSHTMELRVNNHMPDNATSFVFAKPLRQSPGPANKMDAALSSTL